jgi:hypothetical protein
VPLATDGSHVGEEKRLESALELYGRRSKFYNYRWFSGWENRRRERLGGAFALTKRFICYD